MNGAVVGLGALLLGVPLAGPIAIVTFVTSYIPFFGAFFAGAFAVLVALGAKGLSVALAMLAITLLANNTLQNLLEPVAFGRTLRLHPLTVLLVTTAGTLLFGVLGATLAAPVTAVTLRTIGCSARSACSRWQPRPRLGPPSDHARRTLTRPPRVPHSPTSLGRGARPRGREGAAAASSLTGLLGRCLTGGHGVVAGSFPGSGRSRSSFGPRAGPLGSGSGPGGS
jgi:hypothetical protein